MSRIITWSSAAISLGGIGDAKLLTHFQKDTRDAKYSRRSFREKRPASTFYDLL